MTAQDPQPLISHLIELRKRIIHCLISLLVVFLCLVYFSNDIYHAIAEPLIKQLPQGATMIATDVASPLLAPIKLTFYVSLFIAAPMILYQLWAFIAPALYKNERQLIMPLLFSSTVLFYVGMAFAYFVVFPLAFAFFSKTAPSGVMIATDINNYLDFVMTVFFAFGVAFEIPIAIILLCWSGMTSADDLKKKRPYVIVVIFVIAMLLTPPDVFSQTLLALPMCLLFEIGLFCSRFYVRKQAIVP